MQIPTVNSCCCGCTLKTGCAIIGIVWAVCSFIMLIVYSVEADAIKMILPDQKDERAAYMAVQGLLIMYAILACAEVIISSCLIYGTYTYKASFIFPWLICYSVIVIINLFGYFSLSVIYFAAFNVGSGFGILIGGMLGCALTVYCLIVVNSQYQILLLDVSQYP